MISPSDIWTWTGGFACLYLLGAAVWGTWRINKERTRGTLPRRML